MTDPQQGRTTEPADAPSELSESSPAPEHAPQPQPQPQAEPEPAAQPQPEPEPQATAKPEPEREVAAEAQPIAEHVTDPDAEPAPAPEPATTAEAGQADRAEEARGPETPQAEPAGEATAAEVQTEPVELPPPPATVYRTVSQEVARQVWAAGARYCFTVPAEPILPLLDDLAAAGIRIVTTRHEGGAAFMAEALSQSTGRPQIVATSRTVGAANAAVGIHTASGLGPDGGAQRSGGD